MARDYLQFNKQSLLPPAYSEAYTPVYAPRSSRGNRPCCRLLGNALAFSESISRSSRGNKRRRAQSGFALSLSKGLTIVEVIIGSAILVGVFVALGGIAQYALYLSTDATMRIQSAFLASEGIEAVKIMRDRGWTNISSLAAGIDYYLLFSSDRWVATTSPVIIDGIFSRTFRLENVSRDSADRIVESGGTNDPNTRKAAVTVTWTNGRIERQDVIATYITNLFDNER